MDESKVEHFKKSIEDPALLEKMNRNRATIKDIYSALTSEELFKIEPEKIKTLSSSKQIIAEAQKLLNGMVQNECIN